MTVVTATLIYDHATDVIIIIFVLTFVLDPGHAVTDQSHIEKEEPPLPASHKGDHDGVHADMWSKAL